MNKSEPHDEDKFLMKRCIELALNGLGRVAPNPLVGSVIVYREKIIGEGYHRQYGGPHAEVVAIQSVKDKSLLSKSTLYLNLEPCAHMGKTPPCADLIIEKKIPRVVVGTTDPNALVSGKGIEKLKKAGVEVITDILTDECQELNRRFFVFHQRKRPYIILKWAQSADGFMDVLRAPGTPVGVNWISTEVSRMLVHKWRSEEQGILVGTNTVIMDNPKLTVRYWEGIDPLRIVIDRNLRISRGARIMRGEVSTLIYNTCKAGIEGKNEFIYLEGLNEGMSTLMPDLYRREICSVMVEGGKEILEHLIKAGLWDEARVITGQKKFHKGVKAPRIQIPPVSEDHLEGDLLRLYKNVLS